MLKLERQNIIEAEIHKEGFVLVPALSELLCCSEETVRRDLKEMETSGLLVRTHGGAYLVEKFDKSFPNNLRKTFIHSTKGRLAKQAMSHVHDNDAIMLDSSTTCLSFAEALFQSEKSITIITNSLQICALGNENNTNINLICLGGTFRRRSCSFTDQHTLDIVKMYHADSSFISCPKVTLNYGLADNHLSEAKVRELMLKQARERYLIMDHTKFDASANVLFNGLEDVDVIITDQKLSPDWYEFAGEHSIKIEYCAE